MSARKSLAAALLILALGGCTVLTAERPLFSVADQGAPPIQEGIWIGIGEGCGEHNVRRQRFPEHCGPLDIRRGDDGAWRASLRVDLVSGLTARDRAEAEADIANGPYRAILAPAVERDISAGYASLYLAELASTSAEDSTVSYAVVAPIGAMPATEMLVLMVIGCDLILRDGPIDSVTPHYMQRTTVEDEAPAVSEPAPALSNVTALDETPAGEVDEAALASGATPAEQDLAGCTATTQAAVREAARRAVIENLDDLTERRWVFVRAN